MGLGQFMAMAADGFPHKPLDPVSPGRVSDGPLNRNQESGLLQLRAQRLRVKYTQRMVLALLKYLGDFSLRTEANTLWESTGSGHTRAAGTLSRKPCPAFLAAAFDDSPSRRGGHSLTEPVGCFPLAGIRLKGAFHRIRCPS